MLLKLFLLSFLSIQISCEQKASLAFVIDNSVVSVGDMYKVKSYAKDMVNMILNEVLIDDILVITFNEPEITRTMTQDVRLVRKAFDLIDGKSDKVGPEMALSGIVKALQESQGGSYLYVFTHSSAKDYDRVEEVKALCRGKKSKIFFIVTENGQASNRHMDIMDDIYNDITVECGGEVIRTNSNKLDKTFQYIRESVKVAKNVIKSTLLPESQRIEIKFNKRESNDYVLVSASGKDVELRVFDEKGNSIGNYVTWIDNLKALKLEHVPNGEITVKARSTRNGHLAVFGHIPVPAQPGIPRDDTRKLRRYGYHYLTL
ncbi:hemicentin-2-like [Leguminivora glycinivorella]|uniref:hemicentin-2-like n=1 Tax=Leguminivora glycinivorella TaxID=1035111 RepID=UPI00200D9B1A|nr:hemicentin-2-like [Leguminivora glycinivorella]